MSLLLDLKIMFKTAAAITQQVIELRQGVGAPPAESKRLTSRAGSTRSQVVGLKIYES
jgi:hypothetical protein